MKSFESRFSTGTFACNCLMREPAYGFRPLHGKPVVAPPAAGTSMRKLLVSTKADHKNFYKDHVMGSHRRTLRSFLFAVSEWSCFFYVLFFSMDQGEFDRSKPLRRAFLLRSRNRPRHRGRARNLRRAESTQAGLTQQCSTANTGQSPAGGFVKSGPCHLSGCRPKGGLDCMEALHGNAGESITLLRQTAPGSGLIDYDNDGWLDIYFRQLDRPLML